MTGEWLSRLRRIALECVLGGFVLAALTLISSQLSLGLATAGLLSLAAIGLLSLRVRFTSAIILSIGSILLLDHYFMAPVTVIRSSLTRNVVLSVVFPALALLLSWLVMNVRRQTTALRESEAHWKEVFEHNPTMHFLISADGSVVSVNEFGASQLGYSVSELVGQQVLALFVEPDRELVRSNLAACQAAPGRSHVWEARKRRNDGSIVWVRENAKFVQWGASDPIYLVSCEDITERKGIEEAVRRSQDNLLEAQKLGRIGSWSIDVSGGVNGAMTASPEMLRIFGLDPEKGELTPALVMERVHPDDRAFIDALTERRVRARADFEYDYRIVLPGGAIKRLHSISHPVIGDDGALLEHVGTTMDVTDRKRAEEAARRSQDNLLEAQRLGRIGSWSVDVSSGVNGAMTSSPEMLRIFGLDPEKDELTQALLMERVHPDDRAFINDVRQRRLTTLDDFEYEFRIVRPDGAIRRFHSISHPVIGDDGALVEHVGTTMDVTERAEAEEAVRRSEASLQEAQRLGRMGSWTQNLASGVMAGSPELFRIFGLDPEKVSLTRDLLGKSIHPDDRAAVVRTIESGHRSNAAIEVDYRIVLSDGRIRHVHGVSRPVIGERGDIVEYIGTVMDVTELRKAEEALRQASADLARVSRITTIGALTASLAHEINQPIAAAVANANACLRWLAADEPDVEELREAAAAIVRNGTRAAEIMARTRRLFEKGGPQREATEVDEVVRETVALLSGETARHSVAVRTSLAEGLPEVEADRVQLQQVLMNLILNAIDAMEDVDGGREITIVSQTTGDKEVMVSVGDAGVGLSPELAEQLFETFFTTKPHGTGMGLSISRSIIAAHGGRLWAEPNEPRGAVFRFTLPAASESAAA